MANAIASRREGSALSTAEQRRVERALIRAGVDPEVATNQVRAGWWDDHRAKNRRGPPRLGWADKLSKQIHVRFKPRNWETLKAEADELGVPPGRLIRQIVTEWAIKKRAERS